MSKGFDNSAVGLSQLYAQTRTKTITNDAAAAGATIRANGAAPLVAAPAVNTVRVTALINNGGEAGGTPVRISVFVSAGVGRPAVAGPTFTTGTPLLSLFPVLFNATGGPPLDTAVISPSAIIEVLPTALGVVDVTLPFSGDCTVRVTLAAGDDIVTASLDL